jgi:hypothetical protein
MRVIAGGRGSATSRWTSSASAADAVRSRSGERFRVDRTGTATGMKSLAFRPVSVLLGFIAAMLAKQVFERLWALVDEEPPPAPDQRTAPSSKLIPALILQGAVFFLVRGLVDRGSRSVFARTTGEWPGEKD